MTKKTKKEIEHDEMVKKERESYPTLSEDEVEKRHQQNVDMDKSMPKEFYDLTPSQRSRLSEASVKQSKKLWKKKPWGYFPDPGGHMTGNW